MPLLQCSELPHAKERLHAQNFARFDEAPLQIRNVKIFTASHSKGFPSQAQENF
jgi:hypothetical protein